MTLIDGKSTVRALLAGTSALAAWGLCLVAAPVASAAPIASAAPAVSAATSPAVSTVTLIQAYVSGRHLPAGSVAGIRAGSLHTASVSGVNWAIADFTPSASAALGVQGEFQDGASTGIFRQLQPRQLQLAPWRLVQIGPYGCGRGLPAGLRQAWDLLAPAICQAAITTQRSAATRALSQADPARTIGQAIARTALDQVGVGDAPAVTSFDGLDCDPYSALVGALSPNADGCGFNAGFSLQDENEDWCSDFAKWVWQQAGVTTGMSAINAGSGSFYDWGLAQGERLAADAGKPAAGDAVVFFPPGRIGSPAYGDHVGIVTAANPGGTVNLVNGDFLGKSNISVQYDTKVSLTSWAAQVWGPGEQWVLIAPPAGPQPAAPAAVISGPRVGVTGTATRFSGQGTVRGGSITQYQWTFGDGRTANQAGPDVSTVFAGTGIYPVTMTATSSLHTVTTRTWDVDVIGASSAVTSSPSDAIWYSTTPISQFLFLPTATGGLAAESSDGIQGPGWLQQAIPGQLGGGQPAGGLTALAYPDPDVGDAMTPHAYFRSSGGTLGETYLGAAGWTTQTLAGQPEQGSALAATTQAGPAASGATAGSGAPGGAAVVFYFDGAGQLSQTTGAGAGWTTSTLAGPATTDPGSLALADTDTGVQVFYLASAGTLTVASDSGQGWHFSSISAPCGVAADSPLAAITTGPDQASVFFADRQGTLAEATQNGQGWVVRELPGTTASTALAATTDLLGSGSVGQEVFYLSPGGQPAVTTWNGQQWQTSALPGTATSIPAVSAYPVPGQPQQVFLADAALTQAGALRLDESTAPRAAWTTTTLPDTAATLADRVLLYAATPADDASARAAGSAAGLPARQVTESFSAAWAATLSGNYLVIAVGQAAVDAVYFNQCGWADPSGEGAGGTPFYLAGEPLDRLPGVDAYENAAATSQTPRLAADLAYYATHGALPAGVTRLPTRAVPQHACAGEP